MRTRILAAVSVALAGTFTIAATAPAITVSALDNPTTTVFINEINYNPPGTDAGEFVEIAGLAGTNLTDYEIVRYNGANGAVYTTAAAIGDFTPLTLVDQGGGYGTATITYEPNGLQNGDPDGIALVGPGGALIQFLSYGGSFTPAVGAAADQPSTDIAVTQNGTDATTLQLTGSGTTYGDFSWSKTASTSGALNIGQTFGIPEPLVPVINEFVSDGVTIGDNEFVEIFADPDFSTSTLSVLQVNSTGNVIGEYALTTTDENGYEVVTAPDPALADDNFTLLLVEGFTGEVSDDLDAGDDGSVDDPAPWSDLLDSVAVNDGVTGDSYSETVLTEVGGASRIPNGADTDTAADWTENAPAGDQYDLADTTPGAENTLLPPTPLCLADPEITLINVIQGAGLASPIIGEQVTIQGIVVGDFQNGAAGTNGDLDGFYVQEEDADADADPATSEGIFVFDGLAPETDVAVGVLVRVSGVVDEEFGLTRIETTGTNTVDVCDTDQPPPTPASPTLPVAAVTVLERFEGMSINISQALTITEYFNFGRFGEIVLATERQFQPTAIAAPGSLEAAAIASANALGRITLDDGRSAQNPDPAIHPNGAEFDLDNLFRGGDTVSNIVGVMDYSFSLYRVQPTAGANYTAVDPRPAAPDPVGGTLKVGAMNVLNYFNTLTSAGTSACGPTGGQECRGADNATERTRQLDKIVSAIVGLDQAVTGIMEVQNSSIAQADQALVDIVTGLNAATSPGHYDFIATGPVGTDAIKNAIIYQPSLVTPAGAYAVLDIDAAIAGPPRNRPAIAQAFAEVATGEVFSVVVNHLKSKGSSCGGAPNDDPEQGNCNGTRTQAAEALVDWILTDPTGQDDDDYIIVGDLNSYDYEDPIGVLEDAGFVDLIKQYQGDEAYSYVFNGQFGYLDYALASASLAAQVTGANVWQINADEVSLIDYDTSFKQAAQDAIYAPDAYRSSDHDPVVVGLALAAAVDAPTVTINQAVSQADPTNVGSVAFTVLFSEVVTGFTAEDITVGGTASAGTPVVTGDGPAYTVTIPVSSSGTVTASIPAGAADAGGAMSQASTSTDNTVTVEIDIVGPSVTLDQSAAQADPTAASPIAFTVVFTEPVTGFDASDIALGGTAGATTVNVSGSGAIYIVEVSGMTSDGTVTASVKPGAVTDGAGNPSLVSTSTDSTVTYNAFTVNPLDPAARFVPVSPVRLFDTRVTEPGNGPKGIVGPDSSIDIQVTGQGNVPANAVAVVMNLTVTDTAGPSFVSAYPKGAARPTVSAINIIEAGQTRANLVTVPIGLNGQVTLYSLEAANLLADVAGYYVDADAAVAGGRFMPVTPQRAFDTRPTETGAPGPKGKMAADQTIDVQILGFGDVPETGVSAVVINLTGTEASAPGFLTAFPNGTAVPFASNVNLATVGTTAPNLAIVPIGDGGMISIYSSGGAHAIGDITGFITDDTADVSTSGLFVPFVPERIFDSRTSEGGIGFVPAGATAVVPVAGIKSIPANAGAVVLNVAGVNSPLGFLTAWNTGVPRPTASTVNFVVSPLDTRANAAMLPVGDLGTISFYTLNGSDVLVDASGYFLK